MVNHGRRSVMATSGDCESARQGPEKGQGRTGGSAWPEVAIVASRAGGRYDTRTVVAMAPRRSGPRRSRPYPHRSRIFRFDVCSSDMRQTNVACRRAKDHCYTAERDHLCIAEEDANGA